MQAALPEVSAIVVLALVMEEAIRVLDPAEDVDGQVILLVDLGDLRDGCVGLDSIKVDAIFGGVLGRPLWVFSCWEQGWLEGPREAVVIRIFLSNRESQSWLGSETHLRRHARSTEEGEHHHSWSIELGTILPRPCIPGKGGPLLPLVSWAHRASQYSHMQIFHTIYFSLRAAMSVVCARHCYRSSLWAPGWMGISNDLHFSNRKICIW